MVNLKHVNDIPNAHLVKKITSRSDYGFDAFGKRLEMNFWLGEIELIDDQK